MPKKQDDEGRREVIARVEAMSHPLRIDISSVLTQHSAMSAAEVAAELDEPVERVRYQLRHMVKAGVVRVSRVRRRRGVVERFYRGNEEAMIFQTDELNLVPESKRRKMNATYLSVSFREALKALSSGSLIGREGAANTRTPMLLDERGWAELALVYRQAFDGIQKVKADCAKRLSGSEEDLISATAILLCFENGPRA